MKLIDNFLELFSNDVIKDAHLDIQESLQEANISINYDSFILPNKEDFLNATLSLCNILGNDSLELLFKVIDTDSDNFDISPEITYTLKDEDNTNESIASLYSQIEKSEFDKIEQEEIIRLEISIKKPFEIKKIHRIYFFEHFFDYLNTLSLKQLLNNVFPKFKSKQIFLIDENIEEFNSFNFYFIHKQGNLHHLLNDAIDEKSILSNYNLNCHFINSNLNITPFSFFLEVRANYDVVNDFFDNLLLITSIIFISNYTELIDDNKFKIHINGYKLINECIDYSSLSIHSNVFFKIFKWVYENKKSSDKLELARNMISLDYHEGLCDIKDSTLASIKSNYSIYLKENVEKYIELKTQITDNILNLSINSRAIITDFSSNFKNAFIANLSFIFAVLILNIVGTGTPPENIFNSDLTIIYIMIFTISSLYLLFSYISTRKDLTHYSTILNNLKEMYAGLISEDDLDNTFNNKIFNNDKKYIIQRTNFYSFLWVLTIIISIIGLYFLSMSFETFVDNNVNDFKEVFKTKA